MLVRSSEGGGFLRANRAFLERVGFSPAELRERPFLAWVDSEGQRRVEAALAEGGGSCDIEHKTRDGQGFAMRVQVSVAGHEATVMARCSSVQNPLVYPDVEEGEDNMRGTLHTIALILEEQNPGYKCSILLVADNKFVKGAGPSLPDEYNNAIDGFAIGPTVGSCGTAIYWNVPVIVEDIQQDPLWTPFRELATMAGVAACWSHPFLSRGGSVLGALAFYSVEPGSPTPEQLSLLRAAARLTGLAVERGRAEDALRRSESEARERARLLERANQTIRTQTAAVLESTRIEARNRELEALSKHKSEFMSSLSHELRTPLNAMIGYTELTLRRLGKETNPAVLKDLHSAQQASNTLLRLINDVLDFSKIEAGQMEVYLEAGVSLQDAIEDAADLARGLFRSDAVQLVLDVEDDLPEVWTDEDRFGQVLNNLISNAIKATEAGSITIRACLDGDHVRVEVLDTGVGIPEGQLDQIFESFKQVDGSIRKRIAGTGLGLAITRHLCQLLDVRIAVESELGVGTKFTLIVPASQPEGADSAVVIRRDSTRPASLEDWILNFDRSVRARILFLGRPEMAAELRLRLTDLPVDVEQFDPSCPVDRSRPVWVLVVEATAEGVSLLTNKTQDAALEAVPTLYWSPAPNGDSGALQCEWLSKPTPPSELTRAMTSLVPRPQGEVWVVDDDPDARALCTRTMQAAGYATISFDGASALEALKTRAAPAALIFDLMLTNLRGFELLDQMSHDSSLARIPVIGFSGRALSSAERALLNDRHLRNRLASPQEVSAQIDSLAFRIQQVRGQDILVVDDNLLNMELAASILGGAGYRVLTAAGAEEGIAIARKEHPQVVLLDLAMPDMDGFEAAEALRACPETENLCIIACTAFGLGEHRERAARTGFDAYITKPIQPVLLLEQVRSAILYQQVRDLQVTQRSWKAAG